MTPLALAVALLLASCTPVAAAPSPAAGTVRLRAAVAALPVAAENRAGYARAEFPHWSDADGDGCDTREEVLLAEATVPPAVGRNCVLSGGEWFSYYDRRTWTDRGRVDIDHMVPLAEAWDSGAGSWTAGEREAFANDLGDPRALVGVTDSVNRAKSDRDPAGWLPEFDRCRYVREFVAVKLRWRLTVDRVEKRALTGQAAACPDATFTVRRAR
jgi:hypothetical protein